MNDMVVVIMESWSARARVGPLVGWAVARQPSERARGRGAQLARKVAHNSHHRHRHHHHHQHHHRISPRVGKFTVSENPVPPHLSSGNYLWSQFTFGGAAGVGCEAPESGGIWPGDAGCVLRPRTCRPFLSPTADWQFTFSFIPWTHFKFFL